MIDYIKDPHIDIFTSPKDFGKRRLVLDMIEKE